MVVRTLGIHRDHLGCRHCCFGRCFDRCCFQRSGSNSIGCSVVYLNLSFGRSPRMIQTTCFSLKKILARMRVVWKILNFLTHCKKNVPNWIPF